MVRNYSPNILSWHFESRSGIKASAPATGDSNRRPGLAVTHGFRARHDRHDSYQKNCPACPPDSVPADVRGCHPAANRCTRSSNGDGVVCYGGVVSNANAEEVASSNATETSLNVIATRSVRCDIPDVVIGGGSGHLHNALPADLHRPRRAVRLD